MSTSVNQAPRAIPDAVIRSLKQNTSIQTLVQRYGVKPIRVGNGYKAICPFHKVNGHAEHTPSLSLMPDVNGYRCFSCNETGDVITWVMKMDGLDFVKAVEKLLALCPVPICNSKPQSDEKKTEAVKGKNRALQPQVPTIGEETRQAVLREVVRRATEELRSSEPGRKYLARIIHKLS